MRLSIVIICWNDQKVIQQCIESIYSRTAELDFEVIVSDNGSTDDSLALIRRRFPEVKIVENHANIGFGRGNNAGIRVASGDYVLILNPDTIIIDGALKTLVRYAEEHSDAGAFGARVLNPDGSFQNCARPIPTVGRYLIAALYLRFLGYFSEAFVSDLYPGWSGKTEREIGFQSGCCVMFRKQLLDQLKGFDEQFFYHFEEVDLCYRVWKAGKSIRFCPKAEIIHLGGQSVSRAPIRFALETYRSRYRFFYKHFGEAGLRRIRWVSLLHVAVRWFGYSVLAMVRPGVALRDRLECYRILLAWNWQIDPVRFVREGVEPQLGVAPLTPPPASPAAAVS